ncbi:MAG: hypothetical protein KY461_10900 [Actinobacteria bacterium]|nr:hypothetical protein [Actinomycetota bacterium]
MHMNERDGSSGSTAVGSGHRVAALLRAAAAGSFPPVTGAVEVVPRCPPGNVDWVVSFTGHAVVASARRDRDIHARGPDGYGGALAPTFLLWLAGDDGRVGCQDVVLVASGQGRADGSLSPRHDLDGHARVEHARQLRSDVHVYGDDTGFVTLGIGLGGLAEMSVEITAEHGRGRGLGRSLIRRGLALADPADVVVAQVTPGNARSLRAFLAAGFVPVGSAVAITPQQDRSDAGRTGGRAAASRPEREST